MEYNYKAGDEVIILDTKNTKNGNWHPNGSIGNTITLNETNIKDMNDASFTLANNKYGVNFSLNDIELVHKLEQYNIF